MKFEIGVKRILAVLPPKMRCETKMEKKKIYLFCSAGMSTTLLLKKMQKEADDQGAPVEIHAFPVSDISAKGGEADIILLSPQVRYKEHEVQEEFPNSIVSTIEMRDYGMMDGKKVFIDAFSALG